MRKTFAATLISLFSLNAYSQQYEGYTLIAAQNSTTALLIDTNGTTYHSWTGLTGNNGYSAYLLAGGVLLRSVSANNNTFPAGGRTGRFQKVSWTGTILWDVTISSTTECMHHDILPMPNGNVMVIAWESKSASQVSAAGSTVSHTMFPDKIVEYHQTGTNTYSIAWEWHAWDHLMQNNNSGGANYVSSIVNNPQLLNINYGNNGNNSDWLHLNGLDYNETLDQIAVSSHNMNEFYVIDHSTTTAEAAGHTGGNSGKGGDLLYRWGNPAAYSASGSTNFSTIHDAHWVPAGCPRAGYLVGYNNNGGANGRIAIDMVNPPINGFNYNITTGQAFAPATYDYRFQTNSNSNNMGSSEQFPNGNQLITIPLSRKVYEINANGDSLWGYTASGNLPQAHHYTNCFVNGPSSVSAAANNTTICAGEQVQLTSSATGLGTYTYTWSIGASTANTTVTPLSTTTYIVTVSLNSGCTATSSITINVNQVPNASAGNNVSIASGNSTTLTASGGTTYAWSNGANTQSTSVSPTSTTTYTVTVSNGNCSATSSVVVTVTGGTLTTTASANPTSICSGENIQLNSTPSGGSGTYTFMWSSTPAGFNSTSQNTSASPTANTTYTVTVSDGSTTATASVDVTVTAFPNADAGNDTTISFGGTATLTATGGTNYSWNNGGNTAIISVSPSFTTTYTVTVSNSNCSATADVTVTVIGGALSAVVSASDTTICNGETTQLFAVGSGGLGNYTYSWASVPSGFSSTLSNPYITPTVTTVYLVTVSDGSNSVAQTFTVTVSSLPAQPTITQNDTFLVSSSPTGNQWYYYGVLINGSTGQTLDPNLDGSYQVQVVDSNGCGSPLSDAYVFTQPTGITDVDFSSSVLLFPNPATNVVTLQGEVLQHSFEVKIFDPTGKNIFSDRNNKAIVTEIFSNGTYFMSIQLSSGETVNKKFIVNK